jgi:TolB protein
LTHAPGRDAHPQFLPDGRIVFQSPRDYAEDGEVDLYVMDPDGQNQRRLLAAPGFDGVPVPAPDGRRLAFQRSQAEGDAFAWELYVVDVDGTNERRLTDEAWSSQVPSFSPDGRHLLFFADREGPIRLHVMTLESGAVRPLPPPPAGHDLAAAYSPDGRHIAFTSSRDDPTGAGDLYVMEATGGNVRRLTTGLGVGAQPSWSPDGERIVTSGMANGSSEIFVVDLKDGNATRLTRGFEGVR